MGNLSEGGQVESACDDKSFANTFGNANLTTTNNTFIGSRGGQKAPTRMTNSTRSAS